MATKKMTPKTGMYGTLSRELAELDRMIQKTGYLLKSPAGMLYLNPLVGERRRLRAELRRAKK
jgi:hypothetical protein